MLGWQNRDRKATGEDSGEPAHWKGALLARWMEGLRVAAPPDSKADRGALGWIPRDGFCLCTKRRQRAPGEKFQREMVVKADRV